MPTLDWIGKKAVINHHRQVPYRLLHRDPNLSAGDPDAGNLLVQGDNLEALKALLPYYTGQVKCIYIDPPYNTGNEGWVYNDRVNSPEIRKWLEKAVGREAEDLSRHDKWLCMMYPRLSLLREFLSEDGAIFVSIDDNEVHNLRLVMDEIFGTRNFVAAIIWQKVYSPKNSAKYFSEDHDYILVYSKNKAVWRPNLLARSSAQDKLYKNPDNDHRGPWKTSDLSARNPYSKGTYSITCPSGRVISNPPKGAYWRYSEQKFKELDEDGRIWWGKNRNSIPQIKRFLSEVKKGRVPQTFWPYQEVGHTQEAKKEIVAVCDFADSPSVFITPKPTRLIQRIVGIASDNKSIILDSFAGSGTTGHAVLAQNRADGGNRKFILVEMEPDVCRDVAAQRLQRVAMGYNQVNGDKSKAVDGLGGGFKYCVLGKTLFDETGNINGSVKFDELAAHVFFTETGVPIPDRNLESPLLGIHEGKAVYLLFNGVMGDRQPHGGNILTGRILAELTPYDGPKVIYGEGCRLSPSRLRREGIVFKQVPYEIKVS
ncbi:MAG: site-specific DNA-methyltransferase [Deltaproteobacteria bacterium]|nr:site-specific DNA-methyltransferase [Deltaproteobacteria bacterium]